MINLENDGYSICNIVRILKIEKTTVQCGTSEVLGNQKRSQPHKIRPSSGNFSYWWPQNKTNDQEEPKIKCPWN
jgi:hypothetical protein